MIEKISKWLTIVNTIAIIVIALALVGGNSQLGAIGTRFPNGIAIGSGASITTAGELVIGANGGSIKEVKSTTCTLSVAPALLPLTASTTAPFYCAITGVASGDQVFVTIPNNGGSGAGLGGIRLDYATASSTAGFIEVGLSTGSVATSSFPLATTSVQVLYFDN